MLFLAHHTRGGFVALIIASLLLSIATLANSPQRASANIECASTMDLMLVLDGSESISWAQFDTLQTFASDLVGQLSISSADIHVGIVQFSGEGQGRAEIGLSDDAGAVQAAIFAMEQIVGVTDIQEGIALGQEQLTAAGRSGVPHVIVLVTDGEHNQPGDPAAEAVFARSLGTEIFAVAIGSGPEIAQLNAIVTEPAGDHIFSVDDFDGLTTILETLVQEVCPPKPTETPPASPTPPPSPTGQGTPTPPPPGDATPTPVSPEHSTPTPPGDATATSTPRASPTETPPSGESDGEPGEVLGVTQLPPAGGGSGLLAVARRAAIPMALATAVIGAASSIAATAYWRMRRRAED